MTEDSVEGPPLDSDLCRLDADVAGTATLLLDLRQPLDEVHLGAPRALLRDMSVQIPANAELRVFALTNDADAPRHFLGRMCKPYANADLAVRTAKDQNNSILDCDDLPAQLTDVLRQATTAFCARREAITDRIDALVNQPETAPVANADLVEAIEDTLLDLAGRAAPHTIVIFSVSVFADEERL